MGAGFPERFVSILRMVTAGLPRREKSLVMAICRRSCKIDDAPAAMRQLSGSRGGGGRQDALSTKEAAEPRTSYEFLGAAAAYREAKKTRGE